MTNSLCTKPSLLGCFSPSCAFQVLVFFVLSSSSSLLNWLVHYQGQTLALSISEPRPVPLGKEGWIYCSAQSWSSFATAWPNLHTVASLKLLGSTHVGWDYTPPPVCGRELLEDRGYRQHRKDCKHWEVILGHSWSICPLILSPPAAGFQAQQWNSFVLMVQAAGGGCTPALWGGYKMDKGHSWLWVPKLETGDMVYSTGEEEPCSGWLSTTGCQWHWFAFPREVVSAGPLKLCLSLGV